MNKQPKKGLVLLIISSTILVLFLIFHGIALSLALWDSDPLLLFYSAFISPFVVIALVVLFIFAFVKHSRGFQAKLWKKTIIYSAVILLPLSTFSVVRAIDHHVYQQNYAFTVSK